MLPRAGFQSRFTSRPLKPTVTHAGDNVTFVWYYHLSPSETDGLQRLVFGVWSDGDISTSLITLSKNRSLSLHSERFLWLGGNSSAVCRMDNVTLADGGVYGLKLDFGVFTVRDFVRLVVIGEYVLPLLFSVFSPCVVSQQFIFFSN